MNSNSDIKQLFERFRDEVLIDVKDEKMKEAITASFIMALAKS